MKGLASTVFVALGLVLAVTAPSQAAQGHGGVARAAEHRGAVEQRGFENRRGFEEHRGFEARRGFGRAGGFVGVGPSFGWGYASPDYAYAPAPAYAYYCPTYGAYYPNVGSCPVQWIPVATGG